MNILDMVMKAATPALTETLGGMLGESSGGIAKALGGAAPAVLGALVGKGASADGASGILSMIKGAGIDGGTLDGMGALLGDAGKADGLAKMGGGLVTQLLGDKAGGVAEAIAGMAGIKGSSASALLGLAAPMVMGGVAKAAPAGMDAQGLMGLLGGQKEHLAKAMPAGLIDKLGIPGLGGLLGAGASAVSGLAGGAAAATGGAAMAAGAAALGAANDGVKKGAGIWPWLLAGAALAAVFFGVRACSDKPATPDTTAAAEAPALPEPAPAAEPAPEPIEAAPLPAPAEGMQMLKLPDGSSLEIKAGSALAKLYEFINGSEAAPKSFVFDGLTFDTGKATLKAESTEVVNDAVAIMKAYPNVAVRLEGHTDSAGNAAANKTLSQARADTLSAALVAGGIDKARIEAVGFGAEKPIADNATAEGKAQNRRIELVVTKK